MIMSMSMKDVLVPLFGIIASLLLLTSGAASNAADLDFGQAVIHIPDTHDAAPYVWQVKKEPPGYRAEIARGPEPGAYLLTVSPAPGQDSPPPDLFLTDNRLASFSHPALNRRADGGYLFTAVLRAGQEYLAEIVFRDGADWINLRRKFTAAAAAAPDAGAEKAGAGYEVRIKQFPEKIYAKHAATFVFEVLQDGRPLADLEPVEGALLRLAVWRRGSWFRGAGDFIFADSHGNESETEAAVSLVFNESGPHRLFAEYRHQGLTRLVSKEVKIWLEPDPAGPLSYGQ